MNGLLAIDPGIGSTGWAYWNETKKKTKEPDAFGLLVNRAEGTWSERAHAQAASLRDDVLTFTRKDLNVYCEMPIFFGGTSGGVAAAETGSLQKLSYQVGAFGQVFAHSFLRTKFTTVSVGEWKGQIPKSVVILRIKKILGEKACEGFFKDVWDAVGIGLWVKGVLR